MNEAVGDTVETIKKNVGINKEFNPNSYIYLMVYNIIASSVFGKRFEQNSIVFQMK